MSPPVREGKQLQGLDRTALLSLMLATFSLSVGYSIVLPILPFLIEQLSPAADPAVVSRHTGLITSTYILAVFLFAPLWGSLSDQLGRRHVLLIGLIGLGVTLALFAFFEGLASLYVLRFLNGVFGAAIVPAAYALVADYAISKEWRAYRFTLLNVAVTSGFFVGPLLGGLALRVSREVIPAYGEYFPASFLAASALALVAAVLTGLFVHAVRWRPADSVATKDEPKRRGILLRLGIIVFIGSLAIGAFEVGLALRGKQTLSMDAYQISMLFAECSIVMLVVQAVVLSPLIRPDATRWFLTPSIVLLALGLAVVPFADSYGAMTVAVALVAASAGILAPIATFWVSLKARETGGAALGRVTAAQSLGQVVGSAGGGWLFDATSIPNATFNAAAMLVLPAVVAGYGLPRLLVRPAKSTCNS